MVADPATTCTRAERERNKENEAYRHCAPEPLEPVDSERETDEDAINYPGSDAGVYGSVRSAKASS